MINKKSRAASFNDFLYKPLLFQDITKKDGYISLILVGIMIVCLCFLVVFIDEDNIFWVGTIFLLFFTLFLGILNRKKLHTMGFRKTSLKKTMIVLAAFFILALIVNIKHISAGEVTIFDLTLNALVYLVYPGLLEELIFRGYLWPRLVVLCGKHKGTLICGAIFGSMHLIPMNYEHIHLNYIDIFNSISSGIIGQYVFTICYSYAENIYFPAVVHAAPHFMIVEKSVKRLLFLLN